MPGNTGKLNGLAEIDSQQKCVKACLISSRVGMEGPAPFLLTAIADAIAAVLRDSSTLFPLIMLPMKKPVKVSPAAVVSTVFTG